MSAFIDGRRALTIQEIADTLDVHISRVYRALRDRDADLAAFKHDGKWHVLADAVERYRVRRDRWLALHRRTLRSDRPVRQGGRELGRSGRPDSVR